MNTIILASASPRRSNYLSFLGHDFQIQVPNIDESVKDNEMPDDLVLRLSLSKAKIISQKNPQDIVIAADTVVSIDNQILGKAKDENDAFLMLKKLQGRTHQVFTGTTIIKADKVKSFVCKTLVTFAKLDDETIKTYLASGEYKGKAGSYALQGQAAMLIEKVEGSVSTVVGLPINEVRIALKEFGITPKAKLMD